MFEMKYNSNDLKNKIKNKYLILLRKYKKIPLII